MATRPVMPSGIGDPEADPAYLKWLQQWAKDNNCDGCTGVKDWHLSCCQQHDFCYQMGFEPFAYYQGQRIPITRAQADQQFRVCHQKQSPLKHLSPMAWWRWAGVRLFGQRHFHPKSE